jgi:ceramide glucosyltransferase
MPLLFVLFLFLAAALSAQSAWSLRDGYRFLAYVSRSLKAPAASFHPAATLIIPVRGIDADLASNVDAFLTQDYTDYQIIFAVAREADPAYDWLRTRVSQHRHDAGRGPREVRVVLAGVSAERGEKVNNLLAALGAASPQPEVLVFADADARPRIDWLRSLVAPLGDPGVMVSTGFRWYLPGASVASRLRAAWDSSVATLLGEHGRNFAWGGSMAIRSEDFRRLRIAERWWAHTVSDDYGLTRAVREAGGSIHFEPRCLVASRGEVTLGGFLRWANRQIIITRVYAPSLWVWGLASYALFCGTSAIGLGIALVPFEPKVRLIGAGSVLSILLLGLAKARLRARVARRLFPEEFRNSRAASCYWRWWPLVPWIMLMNFLTAGWSRRIEWRGTRYDLISADEVRVLGSDV